MNEKEYKAKLKKDPNMAFNFGPFLWLYDGAFGGSGGTLPPGKNVAGFKGKAVFLWPRQSKGRHDPQGKITSWTVKMGDMFAKAQAQPAH